ncbi:MAG: protein Mom [Ignavibacteriae bacterium]|nr:protein Mom [Ignavibacteria bacterium]MBI3365656.1 protein Mom [Ignavibacteriota bacterium]
MNSSLRLDYCSHEAAKYAVEHWHYSRQLPAGKLVKIGVWEDGAFTGCVIFSYGANPNVTKSLSLRQTEVCELTRVALKKGHAVQVSRVLAISLKLLKKQSPGVRIVLSYADTDQGHLGVIYQASNWLYVGHVQEGAQSAFLIHGQRMHPRSVGARGWMQSLKWIREHIDPNATQARTKGKEKYVWLFDESLRSKFEANIQPYPKLRATSETGDTSRLQREEGGSTPTVALNSCLTA